MGGKNKQRTKGNVRVSELMPPGGDWVFLERGQVGLPFQSFRTRRTALPNFWLNKKAAYSATKGTLYLDTRFKGVALIVAGKRVALVSHR